MAYDISLDGKVSNIDLNLPGNYQAIFCMGPLKQSSSVGVKPTGVVLV